MEPETWREKRADQWWGLKVADKALGIDQAGQRAAIVNRLVRRTQDLAFGIKSDEPSEDGMGVHVGDTHQYMPAAQSGMGTVGKLLLAGVAATGLSLPIGAAIALPTIMDAMKPAAVAPAQSPVEPHQPHVEPMTDTDTDTVFELRLGPPKGDE